ncbi:AraC family transcriptional regulator [Modicisalibacter xianhensis]|uniref:AraC-type DNA-binding protein n=1 Tax=Modicisalibacter xianhensis TaxID=442341 RepID=A0A1I3BGG3_9GAMM|nr:AraC family transcriptional regulator [Halomonas xianhensis]SFH61176.1 AraC-type DNA-binding protein [Halomonas xianhensis]
MNRRHDQGSGSPVSTSETLWPAAGCRDDPLSDALEHVRLQGALFFVWEPSWPFVTAVSDSAGLRRVIMPAADLIVSYHILVEGTCWVSVADQEPMWLETGDILVIPHGEKYVMSSVPTHPDHYAYESSLAFFRQMAAGELPSVVAEGDGVRRNRIICGFLGCATRPFNPIFGALPSMVRVPAVEAGHEDTVRHMVDFAVRESRYKQEGGFCVLLRLSELLFVEIIRRYLALDTAGKRGWLAALQDPVVGRALQVLHRHPAASWTLGHLAREVGTSRSVLAERFMHEVGLPPKEYLTRWRMQIAAQQLLEGVDKVYTVAREVGYDSEAAFSRAFKRIVGTSPTAWRAHRHE